MAGDPRRLVRGQQFGQINNNSGLPQAPERQTGHHVVENLCRHLSGSLGIGGPQRNRIHPDIAINQLRENRYHL